MSNRVLLLVVLTERLKIFKPIYEDKEYFGSESNQEDKTELLREYNDLDVVINSQLIPELLKKSISVYIERGNFSNISKKDLELFYNSD